MLVENMKIDYILTALSPAMFGEQATAHFKLISMDEAQSLVTHDTEIMATRVSHDKLARKTFPQIKKETTRYASLRPGVVAIQLLYRGPPINEIGDIPIGGTITPYLIESEEYVEIEG